MARNALMGGFMLPQFSVPDVGNLIEPIQQGIQRGEQRRQQAFQNERALASDGRDQKRLQMAQSQADDAKNERRFKMIGNMALAILNDPNDATASANFQRMATTIPGFAEDAAKAGLPQDYRQAARMLAARAGVLPDPLQQQLQRSQLASADLSRQLTAAQLQQMKLATPDKRAEMAAQYGLQPGTPAYQSFVLLGSLPASQSSDLVAQAGQREKVAAQLGMAPGSPAYQSYVATGRMPREDQQPLTATDKKAILEADEMVLSSQNAITGLNRALELSKKAYAGFGAGTRSAVVSNMPWQTPEADATRELDNVVTLQALESLKATFGGAPTEGERKILLDIQGSASQPQAVREAIYRRAVQAAQRRLQFNQQRAQELRGGTYYGGQGGGGAWKAPQAQGPQAPQPAQSSAAPTRLRVRRRYDQATGDLVPAGQP